MRRLFLFSFSTRNRHTASRLVLMMSMALTVLVSAAGCRGAQVRSEADVVLRQLERVRQAGAYRCAPQDLAVAEANHAFAETELLQGDADRAAEHIAVAAAAVRRARDASKDCATEVVIREAPVVIEVVERDSDGDGLLDKDDECPQEPGPEWNRGCPVRDRDGDGIYDDEDLCPDEPGLPELDGCPPQDRDGDGIPDHLDACPDQPGIPEFDGCPAPDRDGDGIPDHLDACPDEFGLPEFDGCPPPDRDGDGIPDHADACPDEPGLPELDGCPPRDRDGDGIPDHLDACPDEPGVLEEQGCPRKYTLVVLKRERIEISEQVHFATGKHTILSDSFELLNQVAQVLKDHPTIKLRIEGHTDSVGNDASNLRLSQRRANSVRDYLIAQGIDPNRLIAVGFGETMPIASNATASGRSLNRRVEFNITER